MVLWRVVHTRPSRFKCMKSRGMSGPRKLKAHSLAATVHAAFVDGADSLVGHVMPSLPHPRGNPLCIIEDPVAHLYQSSDVAQLRAWHADSDRHGLVGFVSQPAETLPLATYLLSKNAVGGEKAVSLAPAHEHHEHLCQALCRENLLGAVVGAGDARSYYYITEVGMQALVACQPLRASFDLSSVRASSRESPEHATTYELFRLLEERGFVWRQLPIKRKRALGPTRVFSIDLQFPDGQDVA